MVCEKEIVNEKKKKPVEHFLPLWSRDSVSASLSLSFSFTLIFLQVLFCLPTHEQGILCDALPSYTFCLPLKVGPCRLLCSLYIYIYKYMYPLRCVT